jgi:hypothetical protein
MKTRSRYFSVAEDRRHHGKLVAAQARKHVAAKRNTSLFMDTTQPGQMPGHPLLHAFIGR